GLFVDYPSDRATRRGSCILIHIWSAPDIGTAGCVGLPEDRVRVLQSFLERVRCLLSCRKLRFTVSPAACRRQASVLLRSLPGIDRRTGSSRRTQASGMLLPGAWALRITYAAVSGVAGGGCVTCAAEPSCKRLCDLCSRTELYQEMQR